MLESLEIMETLNMHAPIRHKRVKGNSVPWITPEIKCMMRNRDYHKKYAIKHDLRLHWEKFQLLHNKVNTEIRNLNIFMIKLQTVL